MATLLHPHSELIAEEGKRAALYAILSEAFSSPVLMRPFAEELWELAEDLPEGIARDSRSLAKAGLKGDTEIERIGRDYARMFLAPSSALIPPYASIYLDPKGSIMGQVSREVAAYYAGASLVPDGVSREAPDHVSVEWEFMRVLTSKYIDSADRVWLDRREDFRDNHLLKWMPSFTEDLSSHAETSFYIALAELLKTVCNEGF